MVRAWNQDPSRDLATAHPPVYTTKAHKLSSTPRFYRDGTSRIPSFVNARDAQGLESVTSRPKSPHTSTHAIFADRLCNERANPTIEDAVAAKLGPTPSTAPRLTSDRGRVANDARFGLLRDPYPQPLGPGQYDTEGASPSLGPLRSASPLRGCRPALDPMRMSASFCAPSRAPPFAPHTDSPDAVYVGPGGKVPPPKVLPLSKTDLRPDASDWRYASRIQTAGQGLPDLDLDVHIDQRGMEKVLATRAAKTSIATLSMSSTEPRFGRLPNGRKVDLRLWTLQAPEDTTHLGPGAYTPHLSLGGARRRTYRLYSADHGPVPPKHFAPSHYRRPATTGGSTFSGVDREQKYGPYNAMTDSKLSRTH